MKSGENINGVFDVEVHGEKYTVELTCSPS